MSDPGDEEKRDRQMIELLNEVRVAMPGVQILFGFLLTVPFSQRFAETTAFQKNVYFVTLLCVGLSTACLIAPSTAHRVLFHRGQRPWLIAHANRMFIAGSVFLALGLLGAVLLVTDFIFGAPLVFVVPPLLAAAIALLWYAYPYRRRRALSS